MLLVLYILKIDLNGKLKNFINGTVPRDFRLKVFFHESVFHQPLSRVFSNFVENSWRFSQLKVAPSVSLTLEANGKNLQSEKF